MTAHAASPPQTGPYGGYAHDYHRAGWSPLPLPAGQKKHPPAGWTGYRGQVPSAADVHAWTETHHRGNIALRLPPDVVGLDVDAYDSKIGGPVLAHLQETLGALPPTWRSTARDDGTSGIRLYRAPAGMHWPTEAGPGIEIIRHEHRYMVVWPSVHPTGATYRWHSPDGTVVVHHLPAPDDLPALPDAWVQHLTGGRTQGEHPTSGMDDTAAHAWIDTHGTGAPCDALTRALDKALDELATAGGSRHDAMLKATNRLTWMAATGHTGLQVALDTYQAAWLQALGSDRHRDEATSEWERAITGAADRAAAGVTDPGTTDPCTDPFHGILPPGADPQQQATAPTAGQAAGSSTTLAAPAPAAAPPGTAGQGEQLQQHDPHQAAQGDAGDELAEVQRTTWWPRTDAVEAALTGENVDPPPVMLERTDGACALYAGRVNGIIGPSESGKTWVALAAVVQAVQAGHRATILDFEDTPAGTIGRLLALGLTGEEIRARVAYIDPDEPIVPMSPAGRDLTEHLQHWAPHLVVLDGYNAAMTLQGWEMQDNTDVTKFSQRILKPLADDDRTVLYIDHTPKSSDHGTSGGIGAQAKRAMTTGCTLRAEVIDPWGRGQPGRARLWVDKDRPGHVRGVAAPAKAGHHFADFDIAPAVDRDGMCARLLPPSGMEYVADRSEITLRKRKTEIMEYMRNRREARHSDIYGVVGGKKTIFTKALSELVESHHLGRVTDDRNVHIFAYLQPYDADLDGLVAGGSSDPLEGEG